MWTITNSTQNSIAVTDIPIQQTILPNSTAQFNYQDVLTSKILAESLASGALCVTDFGDFAAVAGDMLPITYTPHVLATEIQSGNSNPFTFNPFRNAMFMLNVTSISAGATLSIGYENWDGTTYYPMQTIISNVNAPGPISQNTVIWGMAGRFTWNITGTNPSVTFSLVVQCTA